MKVWLLVVGFVSIALFGTESLLPQTCVAFQLPVQTIGARSNRPISSWQSMPKWQSSMPKTDPQRELMSSSAFNDESHLASMARGVVTTCMDALLRNDKPWTNAGLEVCFDLSSDRCRAALGGSLEDFIAYASNPTFGPMTNAKEYSVVNVGPVIAATMTRGAMQTVLIKVTPSKGGDRDRTFLW